MLTSSVAENTSWVKIITNTLNRKQWFQSRVDGMLKCYKNYCAVFNSSIICNWLWNLKFYISFNLKSCFSVFAPWIQNPRTIRVEWQHLQHCLISQIKKAFLSLNFCSDKNWSRAKASVSTLVSYPGSWKQSRNDSFIPVCYHVWV